MFLPTLLKWTYIYELPLNAVYGQDCIEFPERMICFGNEMPAPADLTYMNVSYNDVVRSTCQKSAPWHLARIQQPSLLNYFNYNPYSTNTENIAFVVMDTWMDTAHPDLQGRAKRWKGFVPHDDSNYPTHATHCAGLIGSKTYGTARKSPIYSVRVLDDNGEGDYASLISAIQYVLTKIKEDPDTKYIVSMSLGGPTSPAVNRAVAALAAVAPVVVAAGNEAADACGSSPASERSAITIAASAPLNNFAAFSNYGKCVDMIAPGESILSLCPQNKLCWMSGTSMATPLAAGLLAHYWAEKPYATPQLISALFVQNAARNVLKNVPSNTVNRFLFKSSSKCIAYQEDLEQELYDSYITFQ
jgi:subtilisin family serine protease